MDVLATHALGWTLADADGSHQYSKCVAEMTPSTEGLRILDEFHTTMLWVKMRGEWGEREREREKRCRNLILFTVPLFPV